MYRGAFALADASSNVQLVIDNLVCRRGGRRVLDGVTASAAAGEALVVTGRNGAGKSTLIAAIAGLIRPDSGMVTLDGAGRRTLGECLHLVGHRDALKSALTAAENLAFAQALLGDSWMSPVDALAQVGLPGAAALPVAYLSAGQRRRVALARLLVARRPLWLLDEPNTALDTAAQDLLLGLMGKHLAAGGFIVAATHAPLPIPGARALKLERAGA